MPKVYSNEAVNMQYDLLKKANRALPTAMFVSLFELIHNDVTRPEFMLRVVGKTLFALEKITATELCEFTVENRDRAFDIIFKIDSGLLTILKLNIIDMLGNSDYSPYTIAIHIMLDIIYYLGYISTDEFEKAYNAGGKNEQ